MTKNELKHFNSGALAVLAILYDQIVEPTIYDEVIEHFDIDMLKNAVKDSEELEFSGFGNYLMRHDIALPVFDYQ